MGRPRRPRLRSPPFAKISGLTRRSVPGNAHVLIVWPVVGKAPRDPPMRSASITSLRSFSGMKENHFFFLSQSFLAVEDHHEFVA